MKLNQYTRKILAAILFVCFAFSNVSVAFAASKDSATPYYVAITTLTASLNIDSNGYASCTGTAIARVNYTSDVSLELQQSTTSGWETIKTWTASGRAVSFDKGWYVIEGNEYRVKITATVYASGSVLIETPSACSRVVSY